MAASHPTAPPAGWAAVSASWVVDSILFIYLWWACSLLVRYSRMRAADYDIAPLPDWFWWAAGISSPILAALWGLASTTLGQRMFRLHWLPGVAGRRRSLVRVDGPLLQPGRAALAWYTEPTNVVALVLVVISLAVGWMISEIDPVQLVRTGNINNFLAFVTGFFDPDASVWGPAAEAMIETIFLALMATVFAIPMAAVFSFFAARNIMPRTFLGNTVYYFMRTFFTLVRSTEPIVWAIVFCAWVGLGPFAGMLALLTHSFAALVKLYSEAVENVDEGPVDALRAVGAGPVAIVVRGVLPQVIPPFVAFTMYRWDINVRMATILGFVGAGGIGMMLSAYSGQGEWGAVAVIIICITLVVLVMDLVSAQIRQRIH